jgi:hypothetical protein
LSAPRSQASRAPWRSRSTKSAKAQASRRLALEVQRLWLLSCAGTRAQGLHASLDDAIARSAKAVIVAYRTTVRQSPITQLAGRMLAAATLLSDAIAELPDATRVPVMRPLHAAPGMMLSHWELPPSERPYPYRLAGKEAVLVLDGRPTLLASRVRRELCESELVALCPGHQLVNRTRRTVHFLSFSANSNRMA